MEIVTALAEDVQKAKQSKSRCAYYQYSLPPPTCLYFCRGLCRPIACYGFDLAPVLTVS